MESPLYEIAPEGLKIIETLGFDPEEGFSRLALHLDRLERTCEKLGFQFDRAVVLQNLGEAVENSVVRVRLTVDRLGKLDITTTNLPSGRGKNNKLMRVRISKIRLDSDDPWLQVKTTNRDIYDTAREDLPEGVDEILFLNQRGEVCEGAITNVFIQADGDLLTPPNSCGLLPGVLRQDLLESGTCKEKVLTLSELKKADKIFVGNSVRGLCKAELV